MTISERDIFPRIGRFLSPDWSGVPAPVPYAELTNPQTLNLYQFVKNDPETFADVDGHLAPGQIGSAEGLFIMPRMRGDTDPEALWADAFFASVNYGPCGCGHGWVGDVYIDESGTNAASQLTILGRKLTVIYDPTINATDKTAAGNKLEAAAALINENADDIGPSSKRAIDQVHAMSIVPPHSPVGIDGHVVQLSTRYIEDSSIAWIASLFAHEGTHNLVEEKFTGGNLWKSEQAAINAQLRLGRVIGLSQLEIRYLLFQQWEVPNKASMQEHMGGMSY